MDSCRYWSVRQIQTTLEDVLVASAYGRHRLFFNSYATSIGHADNMITFSRLSSFSDFAEVTTLVNNFLKSIQSSRAQMNISTCKDSASLTVDLSDESSRRPLKSPKSRRVRFPVKFIKANNIAEVLKPSECDLRFIIIYDTIGISDYIRINAMAHIGIPLISSTTNRVYTHYPRSTSEVAITITNVRSVPNVAKLLASNDRSWNVAAKADYPLHTLLSSPVKSNIIKKTNKKTPTKMFRFHVFLMSLFKGPRDCPLLQMPISFGLI